MPGPGKFVDSMGVVPIKPEQPQRGSSCPPSPRPVTQRPPPSDAESFKTQLRTRPKIVTLTVGSQPWAIRAHNHHPCHPCSHATSMAPAESAGRSLFPRKITLGRWPVRAQDHPAESKEAVLQAEDGPRLVHLF